jgi:hypothetical protein
VYQYYGTRYELEEVAPIRHVPIPSGTAKQYAKKQDEKVSTKLVFRLLVTRIDFIPNKNLVRKGLER